MLWSQSPGCAAFDRSGRPAPDRLGRFIQSFDSEQACGPNNEPDAFTPGPKWSSDFYLPRFNYLPLGNEDYDPRHAAMCCEPAEQIRTCSCPRCARRDVGPQPAGSLNGVGVRTCRTTSLHPRSISERLIPNASLFPNCSCRGPQTREVVGISGYEGELIDRRRT